MLRMLLRFPKGIFDGAHHHTHTLDGASGEANNLPPYYALSYIMRIA